MLSMKETVSYASPDHTVAMYKGLTVDVCKVDKTEISLTRQDLVELINVVICLIIYVFACLYVYTRHRRTSNRLMRWPLQ